MDTCSPLGFLTVTRALVRITAQSPTSCPVNQGQVLGFSGTSGYSFGPHLHVALLNPGDDIYFGTPRPFPILSGVSFDSYAHTNPCNHCSGPTFLSDNVMAGDDNSYFPTNYPAISNAYINWGG